MSVCVGVGVVEFCFTSFFSFFTRQTWKPVRAEAIVYTILF